jgi:glutamate synthase (NADPH/NADH) small chain
MVIQAVGRSSAIINDLNVGDRFLDLVGPLGHDSEIESFGTVVFVAGGVGVAPVYPIQRAIRAAGNHVISIFGARNKDLVFWEDKMRACADEVYVCTDDGSHGEKGFVTTVLQRLIDNGVHIDRCIAIGPPVMMRAVSGVTKAEPRTDAAREAGCMPIKTIVSLNPIMVDGTGMCGGCQVSIYGKKRFACVDGPEFDAHGVDWAGMFARMRSYNREESTERTAGHGPMRARAAAAMRVPMPMQDPKYRATNFDEVNLGYTEAMALAEASRCLQCPDPQCRKGCPVSIDIPTFIGKVKARDYWGAFRTIKESNPCPGVSGRVCPQEHQCEGSIHSADRVGCILGPKYLNKEPIAIGRLERFVADYCRTHPEPKRKASTASHGATVRSGYRVAVVGSGPAGLSAAADLATAGHEVAVFEALHKAGGVLSYGIPQFRLPKDVVAAEVKNIAAMGDGKMVDFRLNMPVGPVGGIPDLLANGFHAAFIATGAGLPRFMGIPGEELPGVYSANEFLTRVTLMKAYTRVVPSQDLQYDTPVMTADRVVVIGAGNVAMDACRCAKRLGADTTVVYRRPFAAMPARHEEIEHAVEEGIHFQTARIPLEIVANCEGNGIKGVMTIAADCGPDGTSSPKPIPGTELLIPCGQVIEAVGTGPNPMLTSKWPELETHRRGLIWTQGADGEYPNMTNIPGVFAAGDIVTGAATVILALGAGRESAAQINTWLESNATPNPAIAGVPIVPVQPKGHHDEEESEETETPVAETPAAPVSSATCDTSSPSVKLNLSSCVGCSACCDACEGQTVRALVMGPGGVPMVRAPGKTVEETVALGAVMQLVDSDCTGCGQCARACPMGCVAPNQDEPALARLRELLKARRDGKDVPELLTAFVAPSIRAVLSKAGDASEIVVQSLRTLGFEAVYDLTEAASLTAFEEARELISRKVNGGALPLLTSCCPANYTYIRKFRPDLLPNLSTTQSPQAMMVTTIRSEKFHGNPEKRPLFLVGIMPCTAKKSEAKEYDNVDLVLTAGQYAELVDEVFGRGAILERRAVGRFRSSKASFDPFFPHETSGALAGTAAGRIFGRTGGVAEAALRAAHVILGGDESQLDVSELRGLNSGAPKESLVTVGSSVTAVPLRCGVAHGGAAIKDILCRVDEHDFIELMFCRNGCVGGGGVPKALSSDDEQLEARAGVLDSLDDGSAPAIAGPRVTLGLRELYTDVLGAADPEGDELCHAIHRH